MTQVTTFYSPKGGSGKTTFNILYASYMSYIKGKKVLLIDSDSAHNAEGVRLRENKLYQQYSDNFDRYILQDKAFDLLRLDYSTDNKLNARFFSYINQAKASNDYDYIIIDLPGVGNDSKTKEPFIAQLLTSDIINTIIIPIEDDKQLLFLSLATAEKLIEKKPLLFWNKVVQQEKKAEYIKYAELINKIGLHLLDTKIKSSVKIRREWNGANDDFIRSTLTYPTKTIHQSNLECITNLFDEINEHENTK